MDWLKAFYDAAPTLILLLGFFWRVEQRLTRIETHLKHAPCLRAKVDKSEDCPL